MQRCSRCIRNPCRLGYRTLVGGVLPLCRNAVGVFYNPSRLGYMTLVGEVLPFCRDVVGVFYSPSRLGSLIGCEAHSASWYKVVTHISTEWHHYCLNREFNNKQNYSMICQPDNLQVAYSTCCYYALFTKYLLQYVTAPFEQAVT